MIYCVGTFFQQEALMLFSVQYLKAAFWLNDRCQLRVQNKYDNIAILLTISLSIFNLATCEYGISLDESLEYNYYILLGTASMFFCVLIFGVALIWISLTICKFRKMEIL